MKRYAFFVVMLMGFTFNLSAFAACPGDWTSNNPSLVAKPNSYQYRACLSAAAEQGQSAVSRSGRGCFTNAWYVTLEVSNIKLENGLSCSCTYSIGSNFHNYPASVSASCN